MNDSIDKDEEADLDMNESIDKKEREYDNEDESRNF